MNNDALSIFLAVVTAIFAGYAVLAYRKSWRLADFRTLKLGRLVIRSFIATFAAVNFLILAIASLSPEDNGILLLFLVAEFAVLVLLPVVLTPTILITIVVLTVKMWRRESRSLANFLLPLTMLVFFALDIAYGFVGGLSGQQWLWLQLLSLVYPVLSFYLTWQFLVFYCSSRAYGRRSKAFYAAYYVVHGAGLINGSEVGKLLANRIKAAVDFASAETILVLSGGKGTDERLSEAQAMQNYAVNVLNFPKERTLLEDQSRTTYENLVFSSKLIGQKFLFFSSDYHVFRAALFAKQLGLNAQGGPGGKTAFYYRVPAFLREFIAVLNTQRKKHILVVSLTVAFFGIFALLSVIR